MASIYKRKSKDGKSTVWRAIIRIKGYPTTCNTFDRKQEADDWAKETIKQHFFCKISNLIPQASVCLVPSPGCCARFLFDPQGFAHVSEGSNEKTCASSLGA